MKLAAAPRVWLHKRTISCARNENRCCLQIFAALKYVDATLFRAEINISCGGVFEEILAVVSIQGNTVAFTMEVVISLLLINKT